MSKRPTTKPTAPRGRGRTQNVVARPPEVHELVGPATSFAASSEIGRLLDLAVADTERRATSLRLNRLLWKAADLAVHQGWAPSLTSLVEQSISDRLAEIASIAVEQAALDEHYERHPEARSDLWELALAAAEIDGSPVAEHPDLLRRAAEALDDRAHIDTVLAWAEGALTAPTR